MLHSPLLPQVLVILSTAYVCGLAVQRIGQPRVVGEMIAGVALGPIVFGALLPAAHSALFGAATLGPLRSLGEIGLVLFMCVVGADSNAPEGGRRALRAAAWVGSLSFVVPAALGLAIAPALFGTFAPEGVAFWSFALFIANATAVTAFPVLARILRDGGKSHLPTSDLALRAAAIVDASAWAMLALLVAFTAASGSRELAVTAVGTLLLVAALYASRPVYVALLRRRAAGVHAEGALLAALLIGLFSSAAATELLNLHSAFGAFLFGVFLPRDEPMRRLFRERLEPIVVIAMMPVFFAMTGLGTTSHGFAGAGVVAFGLILAAAVAGKLIGAVTGARFAGCDWRDSFTVGALMNARGLMELVLAKVGLDTGLIGPTVFTILVTVAIVTTMMTGPLLALAESGAAPRLTIRSNEKSI